MTTLVLMMKNKVNFDMLTDAKPREIWIIEIGCSRETLEWQTLSTQMTGNFLKMTIWEDR